MLPLLLALALQDLQVDAGIPGGNIVVDKIDGDVVSLHQDLRDTAGDWFYWQFRVRGAQGRTLTFSFTKGNVIGVLGPAMSADGGLTWTWLGKDSVKGSSFQRAFPADAKDVRFCVSIPYFETDLKRFLARHDDLKVETLCETKKGRKVERLRVGSGSTKLLFTARHHACEMIASYVLEGILEVALSDAWYHENTEILAIPFVDKDGVEDGDQGKNRKPRDHNRDYSGESVHESTKALRDFAPGWSDGKLKFAMDLHCPTLRGDHNETIYLVESEDGENSKRIRKLAEILETTQKGPLPYRAKENIPFGTAWNTAANFKQGTNMARWALSLPGAPTTVTLEVSYANANGATVTAASARALGHDLAHAIRKLLEQP
jgi:predicted deacylase